MPSDHIDSLKEQIPTNRYSREIQETLLLSAITWGEVFTQIAHIKKNFNTSQTGTWYIIIIILTYLGSTINVHRASVAIESRFLVCLIVANLDLEACVDG